MRNTLILIGQIKTNKEDGLDDFHAVVEATVQRSRPVVLTALAAVLAFIPLTFSVFWGSLACTLIGGTRTYARFSTRALYDLVPRQANGSRTGTGGAACLLSGRSSRSGPLHTWAALSYCIELGPEARISPHKRASRQCLDFLTMPTSHDR